jgi:DNA-binding NtrC family response regulator
MSSSILEFAQRNPPSGPTESEAQTMSRSESLNNRIEALKTLALNLLRELEALETERPGEGDRKFSLQEEVRRFEEDMIRCALIRTGGRQRRAARMLGMNAATLNAKIKRYGICSDTLVSNASSLLRSQLKAD